MNPESFSNGFVGDNGQQENPKPSNSGMELVCFEVVCTGRKSEKVENCSLIHLTNFSN
jgi:hypothetical protein